MKKILIENYGDVLTVENIMEILDIGRNKAYRLCKSEGFPAKRIEKTIRISKAKFIEWLNA